MTDRNDEMKRISAILEGLRFSQDPEIHAAIHDLWLKTVRQELTRRDQGKALRMIAAFLDAKLEARAREPLRVLTPPGFRFTRLAGLVLGSRFTRLADDARADAAVEWQEAIANNKSRKHLFILSVRTHVMLVYSALAYIVSAPLTLVERFKRVTGGD